MDDRTATDRHRALIRHVFDETAKGNGRPFVDLLADDVRWTIIGTTPWSRTYEGKRAVREDLLRPLFDQFDGTYVNRLQRLVAEGDIVVAECRGDVITKSGKPYRNSYCYVFRLEDGRVVELTEYMDTALLGQALEDPPRTAARNG